MKSITTLAFILCLNLYPASRCDIKLESENLCVEILGLDEIQYNIKNNLEFIFFPLNEEVSFDFNLDKISLYSYMIMDNHHHHPGPSFDLIKTDNEYRYKTDEFRIFNGMKGYWKICVKESAAVADDSEDRCLQLNI